MAEFLKGLVDTEHRDKAEQARNALSELMGVNVGLIQSIAHRSHDQAGTNLKPVTRRLLAYHELAALLQARASEFDTIPIRILEELRTDFARIRTFLGHIEGFDVENGNLPQRVADGIVNVKQLDDGGTWDRMQRALAHARRHDPTAGMTAAVERAEGEYAKLKDNLGQLQKGATETMAAVAETLQRAKDALTAAQGAAAQQAITQQSAHFNSEARANAREAVAWAVAAAIAAAALLVVVATVLTPGDRSLVPYPHSSWMSAGNLGYFAARALGVSVMSFLLVVFVRNYRAARHNEIMNGHRFRALMTYTQLRDSAQGDVQNAILLRAADAIFSVQSSGYSDAAPPTTHVAEMAAAIGLAKGKE